MTLVVPFACCPRRSLHLSTPAVVGTSQQTVKCPCGRWWSVEQTMLMERAGHRVDKVEWTELLGKENAR